MQSKKIVSPTVRLIFGIIFIIVSVLSFFQSVAVLTAYTIGNNESAAGSGAFGMVAAILMLTLGIIFIVTRKNNSKGVKIAGYIIGILAALLAFGAVSDFSDMGIYGTLLIIGTVFCNWPLSREKINKPENNIKNTNSAKSATDEIAKLKNLLDDGAITEEEYNNQKKKLLNL